MNDESIGEQLAGWGKVVLLETRGRISGRPAVAAVGYLEESDGSLLIAAGSDSADWVANLRHDPNCRAELGDTRGDYVAHEAGPGAQAAAVSALILKYGTPAEGLGRGPVFRLVPVAGT